MLRDLIDGYADHRVLNKDINKIKESMHSKREDLEEKFNSIKAEVEANANNNPPEVVPSDPISGLDTSGTKKRIKDIGKAIDFKTRVQNIAAFPILGYPLAVLGMSTYAARGAFGTGDPTGGLFKTPGELWENPSPRNIYELQRNIDQLWGPVARDIKDFWAYGLPDPLNPPAIQEEKRSKLREMLDYEISKTFGK